MRFNWALWKNGFKGNGWRLKEHEIEKPLIENMHIVAASSVIHLFIPEILSHSFYFSRENLRPNN